MSKFELTTDEQRDELSGVWKYIEANGKVYIPVHKNEDYGAVYVESPVNGTKTLRAFMDIDSANLYVNKHAIALRETPDSELNVGIVPIKTLQKKLNETYGASQTDEFSVECVLTTYDEYGNMRNIDTLWTQNTN